MIQIRFILDGVMYESADADKYRPCNTCDARKLCEVEDGSPVEHICMGMSSLADIKGRELNFKRVDI